VGKEHRLRIFENRVPRKIIGQRNRVVEKILNEEEYDWYSSPETLRVSRSRSK
jgi:hypothetical protein